MQEIWKDIEGYEGRYAVSNMGNIWSYKSRRCMSPSLGGSKKKYLQVTLSKDGIRKNKKVHRIVLETFCPQPNPELEVNHIDEDVYNNRLDNLEWVTKVYNIQYSLGHPVEQVNLDGEVINTFPSMRAAARHIQCDVSTLLDKIKEHKLFKNYYWVKVDKSEQK